MLAPPWSMRIEDGAPLPLVAVISGRATVRTAAAETARLNTGDVAVLRGPRPYTVADPPDEPTEVASRTVTTGRRAARRGRMPDPGTRRAQEVRGQRMPGSRIGTGQVMAPGGGIGSRASFVPDRCG